MIDRIFSAALTFCVLVAASLAITSTLLGHAPQASATTTARAAIKAVQLPTVVITAKRATPIAYAQTDASRAAAQALQ